MEKEYYLGLDMGTGSTGWAVTDTKYRLCRKHGKDLWGIRLFETANTAEERRSFRCQRRRLDRQNRRIQLLQELFAEEISKIDPGFFLRLKESRYVPEDKQTLDGVMPELPYNLFVDKDYTDKQFHKQYPTIYHLRADLMQSTEPKDVRLVYLALHHILKHRGHFLFAGLGETQVTDFSAVFQEFLRCIREEELDFSLECEENMADIEAILSDEKMTRSGKASKLIKLLNAKQPCEKAILKLLAGCNVKLSDIFSEEAFDDNEKSKISFSDADYEEYKDVVEDELADRYVVIAAAKAIYDWSVLVHILGTEATLSEAKVKLYEKHRTDLCWLKKVIKENLTTDLYKTVFVKNSEKLNNYCSYIGMTKKNGKKVPLAGKICTKDDFYGFLKKEVLPKLPEDAAERLKQELELGTFLPKQVSKDNSVIPYQLQLAELKRIVQNVGEYLPFLKENADKLVQLLTFRIPYYVGPLNIIKEDAPAFTWAVRKSNEKVLPWNFYDVIDTEASAERFIRRMTNKCTYLKCEDVLPKESLLYSKFLVLNELNNLRLNGDKISVELKQKIYENLFQRSRKVTVKKLREYLRTEGYDKNIEISGIDGDFKSSLRSYHDLKEKLTNCSLTNDDKEELILNLTLFGEDKNLLKKRISKLFPQLTEGQIKSVTSLNYNGWGRLSRKLLEGLQGVDAETGELRSIIQMMWETNENLMQLLGKTYPFSDLIEQENNGETDGKITYQTVEKLNVSPAVKRQVWQTLKIVEEIKKEMGQPPKRVFLEMAREKQESKRTVSRKKHLLELYQCCKEEERQWIQEIDTREEHDFKSDRLFLYYTQKGRCMYCGKPIALENLWDENRYDIDHIYPQSKVMDDSLKNRVLTCRVCNATKEDVYPIKPEIQAKEKGFWQILLKNGFIEKEKYNRLVRTEEFLPEELAGFIERQLVETRQSTKAVADILKRELPETELVYVKANTVSAFRQEFKLIKIRELNDYHHAQDAYLNIVVGNTYYVKFTKDAMKFIQRNPGRSYNLKRMFERDVASGQELAWKAGENGTIVIVKQMMKKNSILFTRKSYEVQGGLFDQQLMKKGKGQVPIKGSDKRLQDIQKYGGYNKATGAYFVLVESEGKKGTKTRSLEYIPLYRKKELEECPEKMQEYLVNECGLKNPVVRIAKIKTDTLISVDGFQMHLSGRTGKQLVLKGANQLLLEESLRYDLKKVLNVVKQRKENKNYQVNAWDEVSEESTIRLYETFQKKLEGKLYGSRLGTQAETLEKGKKKFLELSIEDKCMALNEILHLFQCQSGAADLSFIGGPAHAGILVLSTNIDKCGTIQIIHQSVTGLYEQVIDLKTV